jgi:trans-o-hydroxybenzylidenepyruvate hydratase-aldolase
MARKRERLTAGDIGGAWAIIPTPAKPNASDWRETDTVDLDEAARVVDALIRAGVDGILSLGTFGEGSTATWDEKRVFMATCVEAARGRVPVFGGTTSLNTRDSVRETREALDLGIDGTMLGPPMWCRVDTAMAVQFYRDMAEGVPDMPICIYANPEAFKFNFPRPFWAQVAEIPQVVSCKYLGIGMLMPDLMLTKGRIRFLPIDLDYYAAARSAPEQITGFWTTCAINSPSTIVRLRDEVVQGKRTGDWSGALAISEDMHRAEVGFFPNGDFAEFSKYNIGLEKARINAAGWMKAGPVRPPYHLVPEQHLEGARRSGRAWAALEAKYGAAAPVKVAARGG